MAWNLWYEEARDGRFWLFSDVLFVCVKQLKTVELAGDDADALGFFQAMLALRAALPVQDQAFHNAVRRLDTSRRYRDGWLKVMTRQDTDGVRTVIQDPLEAAAYSMPASFMEVAPEAPLSRARVRLAFLGHGRGGRPPWRSEPVVLALRPWVVCSSLVINWSRLPVLLSSPAR